MLLVDYAHLLRYNDWANHAMLDAAGSLADEALDRPFEMGMGTLRRTIIHIYNGEFVWLNRWQGRAETAWPDETERASIATLRQRFSQVAGERDAYLRTLGAADLAELVIYRDSKGSRFQAARGDMLNQMFVHSTHHRAQAANMVRQLNAGLLELDYMMSLRKPA